MCVSIVMVCNLRPRRTGGGGAARAAAATTAKRRGMALDEAREILNLKPADVTRPKVLAQCERYFAMNDPAKGGSIYLQSKITNAKEALLEEMEKEGDASDDEAHNGRHDAR
jgi:import inner membrane translocase subunit TIM16